MSNQIDSNEKKGQKSYNEATSDELMYRGQVQGIKGLQSPSTYIVAVGFAFVLYHINRTTDVPGIISAARESALQFKEEYLMIPVEGSEDKTWNSYFIMALSLMLFSVVLAVKKFISARQAAL